MKIEESDRELVIAINDKNQAAVNFVGTRQVSGLCQLTILKNEGMEPQHVLFEIGCGALVGSILFIRYLDENKYYGVDPNKWLRDDTLGIVANRDILEKNPVFYSNSEFQPETEIKFDYIFAHSIFNHAANWQWEYFLDNVKKYMKKNTVIVLSVLFADGNKYGNVGNKKTIWSEWQSQKVITDKKGNKRGDGRGGVAYKTIKFFEDTCKKRSLKVEIMEEYTKFYTTWKPQEHHDWIKITGE